MAWRPLPGIASRRVPATLVGTDDPHGASHLTVSQSAKAGQGWVQASSKQAKLKHHTSTPTTREPVSAQTNSIPLSWKRSPNR